MLRRPSGRPDVRRLLRDAHAAGRPGQQLTSYADLTPLSAIGANDIVVDGRGNAYVNSNHAPFGAGAPPGGPVPGRSYLVPDAGEPRLVADGGEVLERRGLDRGGFACTPGGADATLYAVGAQWPGASGLGEQTDWAGALWSSAAPAARAGWPGN